MWRVVFVCGVIACGPDPQRVSVIGGPRAPTLAYTNAGDGWNAAVIDRGVYQFEASDSFRVIAVEDSLAGYGYFTAIELRGTVGEGTCWQFGLPLAIDPDRCEPKDEVGVVNVSGTMLQPGTISIAGISQGRRTAPWSFSFDVPAGTHDVAAFDDELLHHLLVLRDESFDGDRSFDIDVSSAPRLATRPLRVFGVGTGDTLNAMLGVQLHNDYVDITGDPIAPMPPHVGAPSLPPEVAAAGDRQYINVFSETEIAYKHASMPAGDVLHDIVLLDAPDVTFAAHTTAWANVRGDVGVHVEYEASAPTNPRSWRDVTASIGWLAGQRSLDFDDDLPSKYEVAWMIDPGWQGMRYLTAWHRDEETRVTRWTTVWENLF